MSDRVWVISGVNSGLGLALALHVASQGDKVIGTVRSFSKFPDSLKQAGVKPVVIDFSSTDEEIKKAGEKALGVYGHVDVLVNNAGYSEVAPVEEHKIDDIRAQFQTNVFGVIAFTQAFLPHFRERRSGHILNMSSILGVSSQPGWGAYSASKAAITSFSDSLSKELSLFNVRVLVVIPGYFSTNIWNIDSPREEPPVHARSAVYTDPATQGYDTINRFANMHVAKGQIGDPEKLALRLYEVVTGTGMATNLVLGQGGRPEWNRVPLGPDCGQYTMMVLQTLMENVKAFEPIWRSTDVEPERLKFFPRG